MQTDNKNIENWKKGKETATKSAKQPDNKKMSPLPSWYVESEGHGLIALPAKAWFYLYYSLTTPEMPSKPNRIWFKNCVRVCVPSETFKPPNVSGYLGALKVLSALVKDERKPRGVCRLDAGRRGLMQERHRRAYSVS